MKSVVPNSSAYYTKKIKLHDLILEVSNLKIFYFLLILFINIVTMQICGQ